MDARTAAAEPTPFPVIGADADERCPRCESDRVRAIDMLEPIRDDGAGDPLFECRECGFAWGEIVREMLER
ncbi:hypothetical protein [Agromyces seonyuensis]|uniref:Uncharacterized protein n=1 Tax=Agromyces seonyuensis TaxID=2662446 RepID=A0A6I4P197_9MICO|nr:hypothetical protein [Agromyces seonyuensis]MWC00381.1 hypothetical protein [Agromyces seonyuensis]